MYGGSVEGVVNEEGNMIQLDLNTNDAEALLHHARVFKPNSSDPREDMRLQDALDDLIEAIERHFQEVALQRGD